MLASIQLSAQGTAIDSLRPYTLPIWKVWRIQRDLSTLDRQTILLDSAGKVIALKNDALNRGELALQASDSAYQAKDNEAKACRSVIKVSEQIHKSELKTQRNRGRKEGACGVGAIAIILIIIAL